MAHNAAAEWYPFRLQINHLKLCLPQLRGKEKVRARYWLRFWHSWNCQSWLCPFQTFLEQLQLPCKKENCATPPLSTPTPSSAQEPCKAHNDQHGQSIHSVTSIAPRKAAAVPNPPGVSCWSTWTNIKIFRQGQPCRQHVAPRRKCLTCASLTSLPRRTMVENRWLWKMSPALKTSCYTWNLIKVSL